MVLVHKIAPYARPDTSPHSTPVVCTASHLTNIIWSQNRTGRSDFGGVFDTNTGAITCTGIPQEASPTTPIANPALTPTTDFNKD